MRRYVRISFVCVIAFLLNSAIFTQAQQRVSSKARVLPNSPRLTAIDVKGSKRFTAQELAQSTGLQVGKDATDADFKQGADKLASSGMFTDVTYTFISSPDGTKVEYSVNDTEKLLPAVFDNFVWMPREDLLKELGKRTPLFRGEVPNAGEMYIALGTALKTVLAERGQNGDVQALPTAPQLGGPVTSFLYKVQGIKIPMRTIEFPGASPEMLPALQKAAESQLGQDYADSRMSAFSGNDIVPLYRAQGFLKAQVKAPEWQLADPATNSVSVRLPVEEGPRYELAAVEWSDNTAYTAAELTASLKPEIGKPLNIIKVDETLGGMATAYGVKGYLRAHFEAKPVLDDAARKAVLRVAVAEGDQYKVGAVNFEGLAEPALSKIRSRWKLTSGTPYDTSYFGLFVQGLSREFDLSRIKVGANTEIHHDSKTVDVTIRFQQR